MNTKNIQTHLDNALELFSEGHLAEAKTIFLGVLERDPRNSEALGGLGRIAGITGDRQSALTFFSRAVDFNPGATQISLDLAALLAANGNAQDAILVLEESLAISPDQSPAWLLLGDVLASVGNRLGALRANFEAVTRAQRKGEWLDEETTPEALLTAVMAAVDSVRLGRREILFNSYGHLREVAGAQGLARVDFALSAYLRELDAKPASPYQKPKFFYFPGLPDKPLHDPSLQPWMSRLQANVDIIKNEALQVFGEDGSFQNFLELSDKARIEDYLHGEGVTPAWEAFFFYRRGKRFNENHGRCPQTSALLDSIELCHIAEQAPEICFSVLKPGTHILPHFGVSNIRFVTHLPLVVPDNCALRFSNGDEHTWKAGEPVLFDDTFMHEAWNRSETYRIVLLMDCWNPYLTAVERSAMKELIETITAFQLADRAARIREAAL